jgi:hypothetical protein
MRRHWFRYITAEETRFLSLTFFLVNGRCCILSVFGKVTRAILVLAATPFSWLEQREKERKLRERLERLEQKERQL